MSEPTTAEIYLVMDPDGDYAVGVDFDEATANYNEMYGSPGPLRIVRLTARMTPPCVEDGPAVDVPDAAGDVIETDVSPSVAPDEQGGN